MQLFFTFFAFFYLFSLPYYFLITAEPFGAYFVVQFFISIFAYNIHLYKISHARNKKSPCRSGGKSDSKGG